MARDMDSYQNKKYVQFHLKNVLWIYSYTIGPWIVQVRGIPHTFDATNLLVELVRVDCKNSDHVMRKFAQCWLTRYPRPQPCIHDPGGEFTGPKFQTLLQNCHIRNVCTTAKNPQSNAVCERMHQTVGNVLRRLLQCHHTKTRTFNQ